MNCDEKGLILGTKGQASRVSYILKVECQPVQGRWRSMFNVDSSCYQCYAGATVTDRWGTVQMTTGLESSVFFTPGKKRYMAGSCIVRGFSGKCVVCFLFTAPIRFLAWFSFLYSFFFQFFFWLTSSQGPATQRPHLRLGQRCLLTGGLLPEQYDAATALPSAWHQ